MSVPNHVVSTLKKKRNKLDSVIEYYYKKASSDEFKRGGIYLKNTKKWSQYWLKVAEHWEEVQQEIDKAIIQIERSKIGEVVFPKAPN